MQRHRAETDAFQVENDFGNILAHAIYRRELMPDIRQYSGTDNGRSWERAQEDSTQRIPERDAVAGLERLDRESPVVVAANGQIDRWLSDL